jgi:hypothetical protein
MFHKDFEFRTNIFSVVIRIRAVDPIEANIAGPSRVEEKSRKVKKGKVKEVRAREEGGVTDEEWSMRRQIIVETLARKKVEMEMLFEEVSELERLLLEE